MTIRARAAGGRRLAVNDWEWLAVRAELEALRWRRRSPLDDLLDTVGLVLDELSAGAEAMLGLFASAFDSVGREEVTPAMDDTPR